MNRRYALAAGTIAVVAVAFVSGATVVPDRAKPVDEKKPDAVRPTVVLGQKTAVFNMAAVMRDFQQAKYRVWLLNKKKNEMAKNLVAWRNEYIQLQQDVQKNPAQADKAQKVLALARQIEDEDRKINKQLNDDASAIIAELYDLIKAVVNKTAEQNGFQLVLAYPDAVTPDEMNSPYIKELKLKPPAAQPFYFTPEIDITARVVQALNEKHPAIDPDTKEPVDISKLDVPGGANSGPPTPLPPVPSVPGSAPKTGPAPTSLPPIPTPKSRP